MIGVSRGSGDFGRDGSSAMSFGKNGFAGENAVLKRFLKRSFKNLQKPFNSSFKRFFAAEK